MMFILSLASDILELLMVAPSLVVGLLLFQLFEESTFLAVDHTKINAVVQESIRVVGHSGPVFAEQAELGGMRGEENVAREGAQDAVCLRVIVGDVWVLAIVQQHGSRIDGAQVRD